MRFFASLFVSRSFRAHLVTAAVLFAAPIAPRVAAAQHPAKPDTAHSPKLVASTHGEGAAQVVKLAQPAESSHAPRVPRSSSCTTLTAVGSGGGPVVPETAGPGRASFVDPSARVEGGERVMIGCRSYVAPFASLDGTLGPVVIGHETNVQDNVLLTGKLVVLGDRVIVAHGATVVGPASIGTSDGAPAFVGFNAYVDGATVDAGAMVLHLARVAPGVVVHAGRKVLPGKFVRTQAEADDFALGKVAPMTDADLAFMEGVLHVNGAFADGYVALAHAAPGLASGAGRDPGHTDFNPESDLPDVAGESWGMASFRNRIIGHVSIASRAGDVEERLGRNIAIRADEGEPFTLGRIGHVQDRVTVHALEHTSVTIGDDVDLGYHVVVHGGASEANDPKALTRVDSGTVVKDWAVVFRSSVGKGSVIGVRAYVDGSRLPPGTVVPDRAIFVNGKQVGTVEW